MFLFSPFGIILALIQNMISTTLKNLFVEINVYLRVYENKHDISLKVVYEKILSYKTV